MRHDVVSMLDATSQRLVLGFVETCTDHPVFTAGVLLSLTALASALWIEALQLRRDRWRNEAEPIRLRRR